MIKDLIIYQKVYDLILYVFPIVNKFPKSQRFVLGQQIQNTMVDIAKLIVEANKSRNKTRLLFQLDVELEKLRLLLRLAKDMKFMGLKVKHTLREKFYLRYMDDFVILHHDKKHLRQARREIEGFLWDVLALKLNPKTSIYPEDQGVDFLGYRIWRTHRLVRKQSIKRMKRKLKKFQEGYREGRYTREQIEQTLASWLGHVGHANSYNLRKKLFGDFVLMKGDG